MTSVIGHANCYLEGHVTLLGHDYIIVTSLLTSLLLVLTVKQYIHSFSLDYTMFNPHTSYQIQHKEVEIYLKIADYEKSTV